MNLKEFFKPSWVKIILAIIILLILPVKMWIGIFPERCLPGKVNCIERDAWSYKPLIMQFSYLQYNKTSYFYFQLPLNLLISYILSCLIILIYDKIKKK